LCAECVFEIISGTDGSHFDHQIDKISSRFGEIKDEFADKLRRFGNLEAVVTGKTNSLMEFGTSLVTLKQDTLLPLYKWFSEIQQPYEATVDSTITELSLTKEKPETRLATLKHLESDLGRGLESGGMDAAEGVEALSALVVEVHEKAKEGLDQPQPLPAEHGLQPAFSTARLSFPNAHVAGGGD
jgi:hypothetical protein